MWVGMFVAAKTPAAIINKLYEETSKALQEKEVRRELTTVGGQPMPIMSPAEFDQYVRKDLDRDVAVAKRAGITEH